MVLCRSARGACVASCDLIAFSRLTVSPHTRKSKRWVERRGSVPRSGTNRGGSGMFARGGAAQRTTLTGCRMEKLAAGYTSRVPNRIVTLPDLQITIDEVYRFSHEDALVFLLRLRNTGPVTLDIAPSTFAVRIANERFGQAISQWSEYLAAWRGGRGRIRHRWCVGWHAQRSQCQQRLHDSREYLSTC